VLLILQRISYLSYPYDVYHESDITLVTLGTVLACFFVLKRSCFSNLDLSILPIEYCYFRHLLAKQTELADKLFPNYPFLPKKDMKGNC
jgi:hypothetical protein